MAVLHSLIPQELGGCRARRARRQTQLYCCVRASGWLKLRADSRSILLWMYHKNHPQPRPRGRGLAVVAEESKMKAKWDLFFPSATMVLESRGYARRCSNTSACRQARSQRQDASFQSRPGLTSNPPLRICCETAPAQHFLEFSRQILTTLRRLRKHWEDISRSMPGPFNMTRSI